MTADPRERRPADVRLERFLDREVLGACGFTAAAARVVRADEIVAEAFASSDTEGRVDARSHFDLASLTKPFVATLAGALDRSGRLPLATEIGEVLPEAHDSLSRRRLDDLLRHRSGLVPWAPLYANGAAGRAVVALDDVVRDARWWGARRGTYSDLGYMIYGSAMARALGRTLERELEDCGAPVVVQPGARPDVVPCRLDTGREVELAAGVGIALHALGPPPLGRAQDGNARRLGGLPGHAGLFGDLEAVTALGREWLSRACAGRKDGRGGASAPALSGPGSYLRGWRRATRRGSAGPALGQGAFGHDGFTGGSLWIDPASRRVMVLLGHRRDEFLALGSMRRRFHALASRI